MILLDTNLLGRMTDSRDPQSATARHAVHVLLGRGERLVIVPQNRYEFWAIATRKPGRRPQVKTGLAWRSSRRANGSISFSGDSR